MVDLEKEKMSVKKLKINKETIRTLSQQEIEMVAGGSTNLGICQNPTAPCVQTMYGDGTICQ
jgi:natural product precursor